MKEVAILILNRNLPDVTDKLVEQFLSYDNGESDIYVIESGSEQGKLSKYCSFWANWEDALRDGLRYPRGFNYGLSQLVASGKFQKYQYFFLVCNDAEVGGPMVPILMEEMRQHKNVGIISPCGDNWVESDAMGANQTRYVWHINHVLWFMRRSYIERVMNWGNMNHMSFIYDGTNFRGYDADLELIVKGYINGFATAVTTKVLFKENTDLLWQHSNMMNTDAYTVNQRRVIEEGRSWMFNKYGFTSRHDMHTYVRMFYERFFAMNPHLRVYKFYDNMPALAGQ